MWINSWGRGCGNHRHVRADHVGMLAEDTKHGGQRALIEALSANALSGGSMHRILLVDDDVSLTDMVREFLELEGFAVEAAHDGPSCLQNDLKATDLVV